MTYAETLAYLFSRLPLFQRQGITAYRPGLDTIRDLSALLGDPHTQFPSIHVGGTNGKGSVSHMLASVLQSAGYRVGLHTSPHLKDFRERIRIDGQPIPEAQVVTFVEKYREAFEGLSPSFFEWSVALAFHHFAQEQVDVAVVEVGMGGRLDSTNILTPTLSVITNIGWDHAKYLGDTLAKIAREKAGIIKPGIPVVIGERHPETEPVFVQTAREREAPIFFAEDTERTDLPTTDLLGWYQKQNVSTVVRALELLQPTFPTSEAAIRHGLQHVRTQTGLRGRWEILSEAPLTIAEVAHNEPGLAAAMEQLQKVRQGTLFMVLGTVNDKELDRILPLLPQDATYLVCAAQVPRALPPEDLLAQLEAHECSGRTFPSVQAAFEHARNAAQPTDTIYVGGSIFVVAEVL